MVPELGGLLSNLEHLVEDLSHLEFKLATPDFDLPFGDKVFGEHDFFSVFGDDSLGGLGDFSTGWGRSKDQGLEAIEAITNELTDLGGVGSVGEDGQQRLIR